MWALRPRLPGVIWLIASLFGDGQAGQIYLNLWGQNRAKAFSGDFGLWMYRLAVVKGMDGVG